MPSTPTTEPWPHQVEGAAWLEGNRAILGDALGTGKTRTALMAAQGRTLAVVPPTLKYVWEEEAAKWRPDLDLDITSYHSLTKRTKRAAPTKTSRMQPSEDERLTGKKAIFDTIIADEAHNLKGRKTGWTTAFEMLSKRCDQLTLLTATPIPNWGHELYMSMRLIFPYDQRFTSYWRWVQKWFMLSQNRFSGEMSDVGELWDHWTWDDFAAQLDGHYLRRESPIELPPVVYQTIEVDMTPQQRKIYTQFKKELMAELANETILAWSKGSAYTKLLILSTGLECAFSDVSSGGSGKLLALADVMQARGDDPTLLFCHFRSSARAVAERIGAGCIHGGMTAAERTSVIQGWRMGEFPHMVATYGVGAEGHTWVHANCVVRVEATARPLQMNQSVGRVRRAGQTRHCTVIDLVTRDTNDVRLRELLATKTDQQMAVMSALELLG